MPPNVYGFDPDRDAWSIDITERLAGVIFRDVFHAVSWEFTWDSDIDRLDKQYGVDVLLRTPRRNVALAVRFRGFSYYRRFGDVTLRYESLQNFGKLLEVQKSIARFMLYGWVDTDRPERPNAIVDWHVIWLQRLVDLFLAGKLKCRGPIHNTDKSSIFVAFDIRELQDKRLIWKSAILLDPDRQVGCLA